MRFRAILPLVGILAALGPYACAATRTGDLEVREGRAGVPCFTIPKGEENRMGAPDFESITVSGPDGQKSAAWRMSMPKSRTFPVSSLMCIPYAGRLPVLPQTPADALLPNKVYEATIEVRGTRPAGAPRHYRARFCLVPQGAGVPKVRPAVATGPEGKQRYLCGPGA